MKLFVPLCAVSLLLAGFAVFSDEREVYAKMSDVELIHAFKSTSENLSLRSEWILAEMKRRGLEEPGRDGMPAGKD